MARRFVIPNTPDASFLDQAEPDAGDFAILGNDDTGVLRGCVATAQAVPTSTVNVSAGVVLIEGNAVTVAGQTASIDQGDASARFDLIVVNTVGSVLVRRGTAGSNPRFPIFGSDEAVLAAVYVRPDTSVIKTADIVDKAAMRFTKMDRLYEADTDEAINVRSATDAGKTFKLLANGTVKWMSSLIRRISDSKLRIDSTLSVKGLDGSEPSLTVVARNHDTDITPENGHSSSVFQVIAPNESTEMAAVDEHGRMHALNFITDVYPDPNGFVTGTLGSLYMYAGGGVNGTLWVRTAMTSATVGWSAIGAYDPDVSAVPTGSLFPFAGTASPTGYVFCNGSTYVSTNPTYADLFAVIGYSYGGDPGAGLFAVPDLRGRTAFGPGGTLNKVLGNTGGEVNHAMTNEEMWRHGHSTTDPGHQHGSNLLLTRLSPQAHNNQHPYPTNANLWHIGQTSLPTALTGLTVNPEGGSVPFNVMNPYVITQWIVKL